jgi:hypothetical protein
VAAYFLSALGKAVKLKFLVLVLNYQKVLDKTNSVMYNQSKMIDYQKPKEEIT